MTYGELKTAFRDLINRKDITDTLAARFIHQAQDALERWPQVDPLRYAPRPKFLERLVPFTTPDGTYALPADYLELIDLYSEGQAMEKVNVKTFMKTPPASAGIPIKYLQTGLSLQMRPVPAADEQLYISYYGKEEELSLDADTNAWTQNASLALIYHAAELAADRFEDERLPRFAQKAKELLVELQDAALSEAFSGSLSITPAYSYQDC